MQAQQLTGQLRSGFPVNHSYAQLRMRDAMATKYIKAQTGGMLEVTVVSKETDQLIETLILGHFQWLIPGFHYY